MLASPGTDNCAVSIEIKMKKAEAKEKDIRKDP